MITGVFSGRMVDRKSRAAMPEPSELESSGALMLAKRMRSLRFQMPAPRSQST
jgi:hypothetical protein